MKRVINHLLIFMVIFIVYGGIFTLKKIAFNTQPAEEKIIYYYSIEEIYPWLYSIYDDLNNVYCYLLEGDKRALLFDTTLGSSNLHGAVRQITNKPVDVILGHGHMEQAGGASQIRAYLRSDVWLHKDDYDLYQHFFKSIRILRKLSVGQIFNLGNLDIEVIGMEGHTAGSIGILVQDKHVLLTSDSASPHMWLSFEESLSLNQYIAMLEHTILLDFDTFFTGRDNTPLPRSYFQRLIDVAKNASVEESQSYRQRGVSTDAFHYQEDGINIYFKY